MAGEFELIEHLLGQVRADRLTHPPVLGPGDDCALIKASSPGMAWAITTDMLVSGVHFLDQDHPYDLGWKTLAVNLSDLAAMGAAPRYVTLAAAIPPEDASDTTWIDSFFSGFMACARQYGVGLIGGDTTRGPRVFSVTALGEVLPDCALRRDRAQSGDDIWVSGAPGYAALGLRAKLDHLDLPENVGTLAERALHHPLPRIELGLALHELAHSAIDVSDGLLQDLGHIARASGLVATLRAEMLPAAPEGIDHALWRACLFGGGDDYELLFTAPPAARPSIQALSHTLSLPLTRIGYMQKPLGEGTIDSCGVQVLDAAQKFLDLALLSKGFDHFA